VRTKEQRRRSWRGSGVGEKADLGDGKGAAFWARGWWCPAWSVRESTRDRRRRHHSAPPQRHMSAWWRWQACANGWSSGCLHGFGKAGFAHLPAVLGAAVRCRREATAVTGSYGLVHPFVVRVLLRVETGRSRCFGRWFGRCFGRWFGGRFSLVHLWVGSISILIMLCLFFLIISPLIIYYNI
jgi:hypothetical protein